MTGRIPVTRVAGGEGGEAWELQGVTRYLLVGSARETAARLLRWIIGDEEGSVSCARTRRSYWWGLRGRRWSGGAGRL